MPRITQVRGWLPLNIACSKTPFRGVFSLVGSRALTGRSKNQGSHPSKAFRQSGVFLCGAPFAGSDRTAEYGGCLIRRALPRAYSAHGGRECPEPGQGHAGRATVKQPTAWRKSGQRLIPEGTQLHVVPVSTGRGTLRPQAIENLVADLKTACG
jgi:hypothetical protein